DEITNFSDLLAKSGLDVRLGVVGYDGNITGAINLASTNEVSDYLNREDRSFGGTSRTEGFEGADFEKLSNEAQALNSDSRISSSSENGVVALRYAENLFSWREK